MSDLNVILYVYGVFDETYPTDPSGQQQQTAEFQSYVDAINASSFTTVVLSTFHVSTAGELTNSQPLVTDGIYNPAGQLNPNLPSLFQQLKTAGKALYYSIGNSNGGPGDIAGVWAQLGSTPPDQWNQTALWTNLQALLDVWPLDGIDFDFENFDYTNPDNQQCVTDFTLFVNQLGLQVTYCPYIESDFWLGAQAAAFASGGSVAWYNLQCYGVGATPAEWVNDIETYTEPLGVSDAAAFVVPGFDIDGGVTAPELQQTVKQTVSNDPGVAGAFVWQFGDLTSKLSETSTYANAVIAGLGG